MFIAMTPKGCGLKQEMLNIPAKAGIKQLKFVESLNSWIPAFAGMTVPWHF